MQDKTIETNSFMKAIEIGIKEKRKIRPTDVEEDDFVSPRQALRRLGNSREEYILTLINREWEIEPITE